MILQNNHFIGVKKTGKQRKSVLETRYWFLLAQNTGKRRILLA